MTLKLEMMDIELLSLFNFADTSPRSIPREYTSRRPNNSGKVTGSFEQSCHLRLQSTFSNAVKKDL